MFPLLRRFYAYQHLIVIDICGKKLPLELCNDLMTESRIFITDYRETWPLKRERVTGS